MTKPLTLWIAPDENNALRTIQALDSATAHKRSRDMVSDRPGRSFESATAGRHAMEPKHDPHVLEKERFARLIAAQLNDAAARGAFDELVLVAPAHTMNELRDALDAGTASKIAGTLEKDLVKTPNGELWPHVREWVSPVRRPPA